MTDLTAVTASLESALLRLHPVSSPFARMRDAIDAARARQQARKSYRYLLDNAEARRDVGISADELRRELDALR
jgi:hypothetical protein